MGDLRSYASRGPAGTQDRKPQSFDREGLSNRIANGDPVGVLSDRPTLGALESNQVDRADALAVFLDLIAMIDDRSLVRDGAAEIDKAHLASAFQARCQIFRALDMKFDLPKGRLLPLEEVIED